MIALCPNRSDREATTFPQVFSGSLLVRGSGLAEMTATGPRSEIGKIGQSPATFETEPPRLQAQTRRVVDDDFGSIVKVIRLGHRIYDNLRKAMSFTFAIHIPIAGLVLLPLMFGLPLLLGPIHIAFLEMVIDPVCTLVFEAETDEDDVMDRPPRSPDEPLFSRALIIWSLLQGTRVFALVAAIFVMALRSGMPVSDVQALTFFSLVVAIVSLILVNRSFNASLTLRRRLQSQSRPIQPLAMDQTPWPMAR